MHAHSSCKVLKLQVRAWFGKAVGKVVASGDICIRNISGFDMFSNIVMLYVDVFHSHMERRVASKDV